MEHNKSTKRVFIYIRKKPLLTNDEDICYVNSIHNLSIKIDKVKVNLEKEIQFKHFYADCVFDEKKSNEEIFQKIVNNRLNRENKNSNAMSLFKASIIYLPLILILLLLDNFILEVILA